MQTQTTVVHCKKEDYDVYIGRPSLWGNPWSHKEGTQAEYKVETREDSVDCYRQWLKGTDFEDVLQDKRRAIMKRLQELKGKKLGCWCSPSSCHGDVLSELVEERE